MSCSDLELDQVLVLEFINTQKEINNILNHKVKELEKRIQQLEEEREGASS